MTEQNGKIQKHSDPLGERHMGFSHDHTVKLQFVCKSTGVTPPPHFKYILGKSSFSSNVWLHIFTLEMLPTVDKLYVILDVLRGSGVLYIWPHIFLKIKLGSHKRDINVGKFPCRGLRNVGDISHQSNYSVFELKLT